jgi:hypothetical protein
MMSQRSKRELIDTIQPRYLKATQAGKAQILDELVASSGYHRKYAIRILNHRPKPRGLKKAGRHKLYQGEVIRVLEQIWEICGRICSKRLQPFLPEVIAILERYHELCLAQEVKTQLLGMSRSTIDRCLKKARIEEHHGLSTTKPGSLLKAAIPVQTFTPWADERAGFVEIDLVAHCGQTTQGTYLNTLTATDIATGWTECLGLPNKTQQAVSQAIVELRQHLPFPLLGLDSDNGSEFTLAPDASAGVNDTLYRYCLSEKITFTRTLRGSNPRSARLGLDPRYNPGKATQRNWRSGVVEIGAPGVSRMAGASSQITIRGSGCFSRNGCRNVTEVSGVVLPGTVMVCTSPLSTHTDE